MDLEEADAAAFVRAATSRRAGTTSASPETLVAAGNRIEARFIDEADGPLATWLEERLAG